MVGCQVKTIENAQEEFSYNHHYFKLTLSTEDCLGVNRSVFTQKSPSYIF